MRKECLKLNGIEQTKNIRQLVQDKKYDQRSVKNAVINADGGQA
jgi:hypothetical protein